MRIITVVGLIAVVITGAAVLSGFPSRLLAEASSATSQNLCSKVFISGLDPKQAFDEHMAPEPGMFLISWAMAPEIDRVRGEVRTSIAGFYSRRSAFAAGRGCTLSYTRFDAPLPLSAPPTVQALQPPMAGDQTVVASNPRVRAAIDRAFVEPGGEPLRTKAVVVLHEGRLIGERYAPSVGPDTPLLGHSITKSVVNALVGVLVRDGKLSVTDSAPVPAWQSAGDTRRAITIENLLRMNAGFGFDEGGGASTATHMWFAEPDTARFAASAELQSAPGTRWGYSSRSFTLLSRIVADRLKASPQAFQDFAWRELFGPLGMNSFTPEFDASGTFMGAQASFATPRDWTRFGQLYLDDGMVAGQRILPEGWVKCTTTPTKGSGYGAGFWLNNTDEVIEPWSMRWGMPGAPRDAFMARGYMGQYIVVIPSAKLVIVRFGQSHGKGAGIESVGALVSSVVEALKAP
jgi:CubicO group peptidase (beta-lactamase class C family)